MPAKPKPKPKHLAADHPVRKLFLELQSWKPYPDGVMEVPELILGTSFFPGGVGLWCEDREKVPELPVGEIMVLGHNFDTASSYYTSLANCTEKLKKGTWRNLKTVLERAGVQMEDCFYTNVYMGLKEKGSASGWFPGAGCPDFVKRCEQFVVRQIERLRPRTILALGLDVPPFLARLSPELSAWSTCKKWADIDREGPIVRDVSFNGLRGHKCTVVCLVHPSYRPRNIKYRDRGGVGGEDVEDQMIRTAVAGG